MRITTRIPRRGFTLIELLVAAGLSMLIMAMITAAFQRGMDVLSELKSVGEMSQRLRGFEIAMRADLGADHFESRGSGVRVSDQRLDLIAPTHTNDTAPWRPPQRGFFSIRQGDNLSTVEGTDNDGIVSTRATSHVLHMTIRQSATRGDRIFATGMSPAALVNPTNRTAMNSMNQQQMTSDPNSLVSEWAEVIYFLDLKNQLGTTAPGTEGLPLYGLYRRVRVVPGTGTPNNSSWTNMMTSMTNKDMAASQGVSFSPNGTRPFNDPHSIRNPNNRLGGIRQARDNTTEPSMQWYDFVQGENDGSTYTGGDLLLMDVISFEIKADWDGGTIAPGGFNSADDLRNSYEFPFSDIPRAVASNGTPRNSVLGNARIYDTWFDTNDDSWLKNAPGVGTANALPQPIRLRAIQIKVRVWDRKHKMARQITLVENM